MVWTAATGQVDVLLATSRALPDGEPGHEALDKALDARGLRARWAVWDDPLVDWGQARLVAVRSTWDYDERISDFLGWAANVGPRLLHGVEVFRWNTDKIYLAELAAEGRLPVVPTTAAHDLLALRRAAGSYGGEAIVKPRVGAGGRGVVLVRDAESWKPSDRGPWIVQPVVGSVMTEGEVSVFVLGGRPVAQVRKVASPRDYRVQPQYGGTMSVESLTPALAVLAIDAVAAASERLGEELVYARIDLMRHEGEWKVSEIEVTEPGLYLDVLPGNADLFADALAVHL